MPRLDRRVFLSVCSGSLLARTLPAQSPARPNIIVILADDLGFGDVGVLGSSIPTPNMDRMAAEGVSLLRFYSASPVCSPSRAALLTGRYPARCGVVNVLMPSSRGGLPPSERTLPKMLKEAGYTTGCIGKWHLGSAHEYMPRQQGFDEYSGVPYSNDMNPLPFVKDSEVIDAAPAQGMLTERFTAEATSFIERHRDKPFFLYFAHTAPHIPLVPSPRFRGKSGRGQFGDVVAELDWSVGQVFKCLQENGLDDNTLVVFTSDNGPWYQGSSGNLRGRKGSTYEGGVRIPFLARFPGRIPPATVSWAVTSMMDLLPTFAKLAGTGAVGTVDGIDIWPVLSGQQASMDREVLLFFDGDHIQCVRWGPWKLHLSRYNSYAWTQDPPGGRFNLPLPQPELYHIDDDPAEAYDVAPEYPEVVKELANRVDRLLVSLPQSVRTAWRDTMARRSEGFVGALPYSQP
jgi:arylsulfatase A-like enzyme